MKGFACFATLIGLLLSGCQHVPVTPKSISDFDRELTEIDRQLHSDGNCPILLKHASLTNRYGDFKKVEQCIFQGPHQGVRDEASYLLKVHFFTKVHRVREAKSELTELEQRYQSERVLSVSTPLKADIAFSMGDYEGAQMGYERSLQYHRSWDNLARYAHFNLKTGNPEKADKLLSEAREKIPANEMRSFAWVELQRGIIRLEYLQYEEALKYFQRANGEYSGYPLIEEHMAETLGLLGRAEEAKAIYQRVIEKTEDPQFMSALTQMEADPVKAKKWKERSRIGFDEQLRLFPEAASGHMLDFWLEESSPNERLLSLAMKNYENRPNGEAATLLAKAYIKLNQPLQADAVLKKVLKSRWRTPELYRLAAKVAAELGDNESAARLQTALQKQLALASATPEKKAELEVMLRRE